MNAPPVAPYGRHVSHRLAYTAALERWSADGLAALLAEDVVIRVAVHDAPMRGRPVARFLFGVLVEELRPPVVTGEITEGQRAVVLFETRIGDVGAQGLNVLELENGGTVRDLTVFFRPLPALQRIAEVVGARMAERFGPAP